jgi:hypothetical protein
VLLRSSPRKALGLSALAVLAVVATSGCPSPHDDDGGGGSTSDPAWQVVLDGGTLDRALLSVWGTDSKHVFAVGGPLGNAGFEALALFYDGDTWTDLHAGGADSFWWVHGTSASDVWMVGEKGRITHYDGTTFTSSVSGTTATLWGVMAFSPTDAWAVGGTPEGTAAEEDDIVLHWDGAAWTHETLPGTPLGRSLFKVWGTSDDDLYVVGEAGVIWHRGAAGWVLQASTPPLSTGTLFTVHGCSATEIYAVGGSSILKSDGTTWTKMDANLVNGANGVSCAHTGDLAVVGFGGLKQRFDAGMWTDDFVSAPHGDLHSVWSDETGAFWAVGGDFVSKSKPNVARSGTVARYGKGTVSSHLE